MKAMCNPCIYVQHHTGFEHLKTRNISNDDDFKYSINDLYILFNPNVHIRNAINVPI